MYKYTPNKQLLDDLQRARKKGYNRKIASTYEHQLASSLFKGYTERNAFQLYWENTVFFSEQKRDMIPVNGVLFSKEFFDVEVV